MAAQGSSRGEWSGPTPPTLGSLQFSTFRSVLSVAVRNPVRFSGSGSFSVHHRRKKVVQLAIIMLEEGVRVGTVAIEIESNDTKQRKVNEKKRRKERVTVA
ncbi:uncharacterized protein DS421_18g621850 [Arachis hypogaea]|nr:uncharacterized protein DS421_18g621850 [Arachis hypogaea]